MFKMPVTISWNTRWSHQSACFYWPTVHNLKIFRFQSNSKSLIDDFLSFNRLIISTQDENILIFQWGHNAVLVTDSQHCPEIYKVICFYNFFLALVFVSVLITLAAIDILQFNKSECDISGDSNLFLISY